MTATDVTATSSAYLSAPQIARDKGINPLDYLRERGFVQDVAGADHLHDAFANGIVTAYVGFDPTARSLHIGNLMGIMALATLQRFGHRPIAIGGGGTVLVGDPSGRTSARSNPSRLRAPHRRVCPTANWCSPSSTMSSRA